MRLGELPCVLVSIDRGRQAKAEAELAKLGIVPRKIVGVNGLGLLQGGGRPNALEVANEANTWSRFGNQLSHIAAITHAEESAYPLVLVCEDDVCVAGDAAAQVASVEAALATLDAPRPEWQMLMLGGKKFGRFSRVDGPTNLTNLDAAESTYQSHSYIVTQRAYRALMAKWEGGCGADAGLVAVQKKSWAGLSASSIRGTCYALHEQALLQNPDMESSILGSVGGLGAYQQAFTRVAKGGAQHWATRLPNPKRKKVLKWLGKFGGRGCQPIPKKRLRKMRSSIGEAGGAARAGGGRTAADVKKFERWFRRQQNPPSYALSHAKHGVSKNLWSRVKATWRHDGRLYGTPPFLRCVFSHFQAPAPGCICF
jgi:hypothetical protein